VLNTHDDGVSLDTFVDWLIAAGHPIERIDDYGEWLTRFEAAMKSLPDNQRKSSMLPLMSAYATPGQRRRARRCPPKSSGPQCNPPRSAAHETYRT
jgi:fatty acid CoA ligase FadD9